MKILITNLLKSVNMKIVYMTHNKIVNIKAMLTS